MAVAKQEFSSFVECIKEIVDYIDLLKVVDMVSLNMAVVALVLPILLVHHSFEVAQIADILLIPFVSTLLALLL